ncbi:MAG: hypothetical protein WAM91_03860 [Candidatus Acidiferrales bacterium]
MALSETGPLSLGEILDRMFAVYRRNFLLLVLMYGLPIIFAIPIVGVVFVDLIKSINPADVEQTANSFQSALGMFFLLFVLMWVVSVLAWLATTSAVWEIQMGGKPTIRSSYAKAWKRLGIGLVSGFLGMIAFFLGYIFFIIPGILVALGISLTPSILAVERLGPIASIQRSWSLSNGYRWRIFVSALICYFMTAAMGYGVMIPAMIVLPNMVTGGGTIHMWILIVFGVAYALAIMLPAPLLAIALCLIYYDARVRKEGFDLQRMIDSLAQPAPGAAQAPLAG